MAQLTLPPHCTAVILDNVLHDRETEAGPAGFPRTRGIYPIKTLEQSGKVLIRDALTVVANVKLHHCTVRRRPELDLAAGFAVLQRIFNQIPEYLLDGIAIAANK